MENRSSYFIVGVFVLVAVATTVGFSIWIAGGRDTDTAKTYAVLFDRDVSGLALGSPVRYLGVDVGDVIGMRLVTDVGTRVAVELSIDVETPVHQGTYASIAYQGITGVAFINLAADPGEFAPLTASAGDENPVIEARDVGLAALFAQSGDITAQVADLLDQAGMLLGEENQLSLTRTLANVESLSDTLVSERELLAELPQHLVDAIDNAGELVIQVGALLDRAEPDLLAATDQLNRATADVAELANRFDEWFQNNEDSLSTFVATGLGELPGLMADTQATLRQLDKLMMDVREDPSQFIYRPQRTAIQVEP